MAKAEKTEVEVVTKEEGVTLHLSMAEVRTLYAMTLRVGGDPDPEVNPRGHASNIKGAIEKALGKSEWSWDWANPEYRCSSGGYGIRFDNYKDVEGN